MTIKFTAQENRRAWRLLRMRYTVDEIAAELQVTREAILQACADGCPHQVERDNIWIVGTEFQAWAGIAQPDTHSPSLILRENWIDVDAFLKFAEHVLQLDRKTIKRKRTHLRHLLEWAGDRPLNQAAAFIPSFPAYLLTTRNDRRSGRLSPETLDAGCEEVRRFFAWAQNELDDRYKFISKTWFEAIRPARAYGRQSEIETHEFYSIEDMIALANIEPRDLTEQRDRAAVCFMFLSGVRADAFVTLPIDCIDLKSNNITQLPVKGVRTKNRKAAITHLLQIPELLKIVEEWDNLVRKSLPGKALWYASLDTGKHLSGHEYAGDDRRSFVSKGLRKLCNRAGISYLSPHKLRHGHAVYGMSHAQDMKQYKAVSQNLMHKSIAITDGIYANLTSDEVRTTIANLGSISPTPTPADMAPILQALVKLQSRPDLLQAILAA